MDENNLKMCIDKIVQDGGSDNPKKDMNSLADYYQYLSSCILPEEYRVDANKEFILSFESLFLWLHEKSSSLSPDIKNQINEIFRSKNLCEIFAVLASISPTDIRRINLSRKRKSIFSAFFVSSTRNIKAYEGQAEILSSKSLFDTKVSLVRLAQVVRFSASKINDFSMGSPDFEEFKSSYDPNLINKAKVSALIGVLKSQLSELQQDGNTKLLLEKLDEIETEIKKNKPHWGLIFSTFFVIFGFTADLKTLNPAVYEKPFQTIEKILLTVHEEGQIETNKGIVKLIKAPSKEDPLSSHQNKTVFRKKEDNNNVE